MRLKFPSALFSRAGFALASLLPLSFAQAQGTVPLATPTVRITSQVANSALVVLKGNTHPMAQARYDQGATPTGMATGKLQLLLKRSPAQGIALREYMGGLQDPHSANYHKWLTPESYGASFGIAEQDLQTVESWLQSEGFKIESVPASRNFIQFSGTTGQIAQAFHTSIHSYVINGVQHYSNASDPQIPAALAPVVEGVSPLNNFHAKPMHVMGGRVEAQMKNGVVQGVSRSKADVSPLYTYVNNSGSFLFLTPADAATIYDAPNQLNRNYTGSTQTNGLGVNIGLVGNSDLQVSDYLNYRRVFLNESSPVSPTLVVDGVDPGVQTGGSAVEALLDAEVAGGLAPQAHLYFYSSADNLLQSGPLNAARRAVEDNNVSVLSVSFGECEYFLRSSANAEISEIWQQAAAQGITVVVASGDTGSASCDQDLSPPEAQYGLTVSGYASTPYNVAVGGTDFNTLALGNNFAQYVTDGNGGGTAPYLGSALSYIPENPWNDSILNNPPAGYANNTPAAGYPDGNGGFTTALIGGGGGPSGYCPQQVNNDGSCPVALTGYGTPPFQTGITLPAGTAPTGARYIPDVSLFASGGNLHQAAWLLCSDSATDGNTSASVVDCQPDSSGKLYFITVGGTSASTPAFAGVLGMVLQSLGGTGSRVGLANNVLYNLAATQPNSGIFHDITAGNNSMPCAAGYVNCGANGFLTGWNAGTGYDLATGLGSVDIAKLVSAWAAYPAQLTPTNVTLQLNNATSPLSIVHGTPVTLSTAVSPNNATGTVSVTGTTTNQGSTAVFENLPLSSGAASLAVNDLPGGSYSVHAYYPGDVSHSPSTSGAIPVTVTAEASNPFLTFYFYDATSGNAINNNPVSYGQAGVAQIQPGNQNAATVGSHGVATGTATLLNNGTAFSSQSLNSQGIAGFPLETLAPGSYSFSAQYSGDQSYNASSTTTPSALTIVKTPTQLTYTKTSSTIASSGSALVNVTLSADSIGKYPSGVITLTSNGNSFTGTPTNGSQNGAVAIFETFTVPGAALASGTNTLTASYGGDTNYNAAPSVSTTINVTGGSSTNPGFILSGPSNGINIPTPGQPATGTISVTPTNGFTGTVNLTCRMQFSGTGSAPTCSIAPSLAIAANTATTTTVTVNTTAQSASLAVPQDQRYGSTPLRQLLMGSGGMALCSLLLFGVPARRRSWQYMRSILVALFAVGLLSIIGCGGTPTTNSGSGTAAGTYTLIVTGTSGSTTANTQISVAVQ